MYLVDTNVLSETARRRPDPKVVGWLRSQPRLGIPAVVLQELVYGIESAPAEKRGFLREWLEALQRSSAFELVPFEARAAIETGRLFARCKRNGLIVSREDAQIAGTALAHSAVVVTRNTAHFEALHVPLLNPFN